MVRKKSSESAAEPKKTGDPFFDDPPEVYWAKHPELKPNKTGSRKFEPGYHAVGGEDDDPGVVAKDGPVGILGEDNVKKEFKELNTLMIPLTELRLKIAELQTMGLKKMPLGDLLLTIKEVYRENKDGS